jgi:hypothetical protein
LLVEVSSNGHFAATATMCFGLSHNLNGLFLIA